MKCEYCGKEFNASDARKVYCGRPCCTKACRARWYLRHRDRELEKNRRNRHKYYTPVDVSGTRVKIKKPKEDRLKKERDRYASDPVYRKKQMARCTANNAFNRGDITWEPCVKCGSKNSQMHHRDYDWPMDVTWLCASCHKSEHEGNFAKSSSKNNFRRGIVGGGLDECGNLAKKSQHRISGGKLGL